MPGHPVNASHHCKSHPDRVKIFSTTLFYKVAVLQNFPGLLRSLLKFLLIEQTTYPPSSSTNQDMHIMGNQDASLHLPTIIVSIAVTISHICTQPICIWIGVLPIPPGHGEAEQNVEKCTWQRPSGDSWVFPGNGAETIFRLHLSKVIWRVICVLF